MQYAALSKQIKKKIGFHLDQYKLPCLHNSRVKLELKTTVSYELPLMASEEPIETHLTMICMQ